MVFEKDLLNYILELSLTSGTGYLSRRVAYPKKVSLACVACLRFYLGEQSNRLSSPGCSKGREQCPLDKSLAGG